MERTIFPTVSSGVLQLASSSWRARQCLSFSNQFCRRPGSVSPSTVERKAPRNVAGRIGPEVLPICGCQRLLAFRQVEG